MPLERHVLSLLLLLSCLQCRPAQTFDYTAIHGFWQSLNDKQVMMEFGPDRRVAQYVNGKNVYEDLDEWNTVHYKLTKIIDNKRVQLSLFDSVTKKLFFRLELHRINDQRIRLLFLKHNGILDVADEYYKTDGFGNFDVKTHCNASQQQCVSTAMRPNSNPSQQQCVSTVMRLNSNPSQQQ